MKLTKFPHYDLPQQYENIFAELWPEIIWIFCFNVTYAALMTHEVMKISGEGEKPTTAQVMLIQQRAI